MNLWEFLWGVWQSSLPDDDPNKGEYSIESRDTAPFNVNDIILVNGVTPNASGDVEFDSVPASITYEYAFNNAEVAGFVTAEDENFS